MDSDIKWERRRENIDVSGDDVEDDKMLIEPDTMY